MKMKRSVKVRSLQEPFSGTVYGIKFKEIDAELIISADDYAQLRELLGPLDITDRRATISLCEDGRYRIMVTVS